MEILYLRQDKTTELKVSIKVFGCNVVFLLNLLKGHQCITLVYITDKPDAFLMPTVEHTVLNSWGKLLIPGQRC